jgi:hypothetical protein
MLTKDGEIFVMLKKIMLSAANLFLRFLNRFSQTTKMRVLRSIHNIVAGFLSDEIYGLLVKFGKQALSQNKLSGANLYTFAPRRSRANFRSIIKPNKIINKVDVVVCCAFLGREAQLALAIRESMFSKKRIVWFLMGSGDSDRAILQRLSRDCDNIFGSVCANYPLGLKWQASIDSVVSSGIEHDLLCILGSDDIISAKGFDYVHDRYCHNVALQKYSGETSPPALYCSSGWYVLNQCADSSFFKSLYKCCYDPMIMAQPLGSGRFYSSDYLGKIEYFLFDCDINKNLDNWGFENLISRGEDFAQYCPEVVPILSMKHNKEMNDFETIMESPSVILSEVAFRERDEVLSNFHLDFRELRL